LLIGRKCRKKYIIIGTYKTRERKRSGVIIFEVNCTAVIKPPSLYYILILGNKKEEKWNHDIYSQRTSKIEYKENSAH
jgi:hypothetical protein